MDGGRNHPFRTGIYTVGIMSSSLVRSIGLHDGQRCLPQADGVESCTTSMTLSKGHHSSKRTDIRGLQTRTVRTKMIVYSTALLSLRINKEGRADTVIQTLSTPALVFCLSRTYVHKVHSTYTLFVIFTSVMENLDLHHSYHSRKPPFDDVFYFKDLMVIRTGARRKVEILITPATPR